MTKELLKELLWVLGGGTLLCIVSTIFIVISLLLVQTGLLPENGDEGLAVCGVGFLIALIISATIFGRFRLKYLRSRVHQ